MTFEEILDAARDAAYAPPDANTPGQRGALLRMAERIGAVEAEIVADYLLGAAGTPTTRPRLPRRAYKRGDAGDFYVGMDLRDEDLDGRKMLHADLRGANLRYMCLWRTQLVGADLRGADLRGADLSSAVLSGTDLRGADMRGARMRPFTQQYNGTIIVGADLEDQGQIAVYAVDFPKGALVAGTGLGGRHAPERLASALTRSKDGPVRALWADLCAVYDREPHTTIQHLRSVPGGYADDHPTGIALRGLLEAQTAFDLRRRWECTPWDLRIALDPAACSHQARQGYASTVESVDDLAACLPHDVFDSLMAMEPGPRLEAARRLVRRGDTLEHAV